MLRKPGFPVANSSSVKMPENSLMTDGQICDDDDSEQQQRRLQLINFGHSQWGFNNWSWTVNKQELDFIDFTNGKYYAGAVAFVAVTVKNLDIHRVNIGYATSIATRKGTAIHMSRKGAVTNALRETLLSFGGSVTTELMEALEAQRGQTLDTENNQNFANIPAEPKNVANKTGKKEDPASNMRAQHAAPPAVKNEPPAAAAAGAGPPLSAPTPAPPPPPPPQPAPLPPAANRSGPRAAPPGAPLLRPNSNDARLENMTEEEARAERKRRQRMAQEEFRQKQLLKQHNIEDKSADMSKQSTTLDRMLLEIPTQEIEIELSSSGDKRKSPGTDSGNATKRRASVSKLDIVTNE